MYAWYVVKFRVWFVAPSGWMFHRTHPTRGNDPSLTDKIDPILGERIAGLGSLFKQTTLTPISIS
jgi:hypothetical protein